MDTRVFQRLRGIRQLGSSHLIYPSANHTRFEHSLGTCWLARKMLGHIRSSHGEPELLKEHEELLMVTALLHDITHIPFGHTFEDERRLFHRHDENLGRLQTFVEHSPVGPILRSSGMLNDVMKLLNKNEVLSGTLAFIRDLVSGTICADLLDYLSRDSMFCGLSQAYDQRIFQYLCMEGDALTFDLHRNGQFRPDALSELIHLLRLRYALTERVYYHHAKVASGAMISKAVELCLKGGALKLEDFYTLSDGSFLDFLSLKSENIHGVADLLDDYHSHRFYQCIYMLQPEGLAGTGLTQAEQSELVERYHLNQQGEREELEHRVAEKLGCDPSHVIVSCLDMNMALKEAHVKVRMNDHDTRELNTLELPEIQVLLDKHRYLWRFRILLNRKLGDLKGKAKNICETELGFKSCV